MYHIKTLNKISPVGLNRFDPEHYAVSDSESNEDGIVVRSAKLLDYAFPSSLLAISRAGVGLNHIPIDRCSEAGLAVFNLFPIPPLDGSKVVFSLLPDELYLKLMRYERFGMLLLTVLLLTGVLDTPLVFLRNGLLDGLQAVGSWPAGLFLKFYR